MPKFKEQMAAMRDLACFAHTLADANYGDSNYRRISEIITQLATVEISSPLELPHLAIYRPMKVRSLQEQAVHAVERCFLIASTK